MTPARTLLIALALSAGLSGCMASRTHLSKDFGAALREDLVAQIADPDARYTGDPDPGSNGGRVAQAQERYRTGKVIAPAAAASDIGSSASGGAGMQGN